MVETKSINVNSRGFVPGLLIIFFQFSFKCPGSFYCTSTRVVELVTGVYIYKHTTDVAMRSML